MQDCPKAVWSFPYVSVAYFRSLKQNIIAYRSSKCPHCIFEIHQLWKSGFSRVYCNCCCSCSFEAEIIKIGQLSHNMYSSNILDLQESTTISGNILKAPPSSRTNWLEYVLPLCGINICSFYQAAERYAEDTIFCDGHGWVSIRTNLHTVIKRSCFKSNLVGNRKNPYSDYIVRKWTWPFGFKS